MKTIGLMVAVVACACAVLGADENTKEEKPRKYGGQGYVAIVNAGGLPDQRLITDTAGAIEEIVMCWVKPQTGKWTLATAAEDLRSTGATVAIFLVRDEHLPISLVSLEGRWAVVNTKEISASAVRKEIIRTLIVLVGACCSQYEGSVMRPAFSAEDLEKKVGDAFTIDAMLPMLNNLSAVGLKTFEVLTRQEAIDAGYIKKHQ